PGQITVSAGGPYSGRVGEQVFFSARVSSPLPPGTPFSYRWSFSDGGFSTGQFTSHTFPASGTYTATVTVTGGQQVASDTARVTITQPVQPLVVSAGGPYSGQAGRAVSFVATVRGGNPGDLFRYQWSFGDGGIGNGATPTYTYRSA